MAGENNKLVKGLGAGEMQLTGDFALVDQDGNDLFRVDATSGDVTASGTFPSSSPSGAAGGDLGGTYPNPAVAKLGTTGASVVVNTAAPPTTGQVLKATSATSATWQNDSAGNPGGADTQVQFNDGGSFGGDAGLTYNKTTDTLTGVNATLTGTLDTSAGTINASGITGTTIINTGMTDGSILFTSSSGTLTQDNTKLFYDPATDQMGLGTNTTSATLDLVGTFQYTDGNQGASKVLTSDASGNATWQTPAGGGITGSGVAGNYAVFTGTTAIGNASLVETASGQASLFGPGVAQFIANDSSSNTMVLEINGSAGVVGTGTNLPISFEINNVEQMSLSTAGDLDVNGEVNAASFSVGGTPGASGGPFTTITSITVVNGIVTAISGS